MIYVIVYFSVLYLRYRAGIVTDEMLSMPKAPFLAVGLLEALGAVTGMAAGAILSGASIPVLSQTFLVWQILLSIIFLGRRYKVNQLLGCCFVAIGVIITVARRAENSKLVKTIEYTGMKASHCIDSVVDWVQEFPLLKKQTDTHSRTIGGFSIVGCRDVPDHYTIGSSAGHSLKEAGIFWSLLMIVSFLFQAADTVLKEVIFLDARQRLKGSSVDLFVVNSFGSAFQAIFICLLLPFLSKLWGIPFGQLPNYLKDGAACFLNMGTLSSVPISVYVFTLPLPYLGVAASLPTGFVSGTIILVIGLLIYAWTPSVYPTSAAPSPPNV
ncbi:Chloroquine-resistance transporter-like transporter 1 [Prunus dulcis]|uniref:Chloroquine-resistance transporter-like transporter 1 n=1 Tax=Prunus dulcis TaxID=3755 RepID=A0A4Y1REI3_PRUDU|nr:Chloroquine-resistance transporter-like transporter 1 [Prunus dulcis]